MDFVSQIENYLELEKKTLDLLDKEEINRTLNALLEVYEKGNTVYVFGNGGSSATASHMVCDFNKGTCYNLEKKFNWICLNDNIPIMMAVANDDTFENIFYYQLQGKVKPGDFVYAISGSGNSHNIVKAVEYAKSQGAKVIAVTGYNGGKIDKMADYHLHAPINDMQITEDIHMTFCHLMMKLLWKYLSEKNGLEAVYKINQ